MMFQQVGQAPADAILGLTEAFKKDSNPDKINLSVGVYQDESGVTPTLHCVLEAERLLLERRPSKSYLPIAGSPAYGKAVQELLWEDNHPAVAAGRIATSHTPGGTGALRVAAEFIKQNLPSAKIWLSNPTWPNHPGVFESAGLPLEQYAYFNAAANALDEAAMLADLGRVSPGDVVLLHAGCHNPTGVDPTPDQWKRIAEIVRERGAAPLIDFAYQGFADGIEQDAAGFRTLAGDCDELFVCSSFSKNFGLYNERVGALSVLAKDAAAAGRVQSQIQRTIRTLYSNPPAHGGGVVTTVLNSAELRSRWVEEVALMRKRINGMRTLLVESLARAGVERDFSFIQGQRGMFSFSGLTPGQVDALRERYAIYVVRSGRINVAGITTTNVARIAQAIADVLKSAA
jgi:aspartate/tyrosine/aromatic aminotransferase